MFCHKKTFKFEHCSLLKILEKDTFAPQVSEQSHFRIGAWLDNLKVNNNNKNITFKCCYNAVQ